MDDPFLEPFYRRPPPGGCLGWLWWIGRVLSTGGLAAIFEPRPNQMKR